MLLMNSDPARSDDTRYQHSLLDYITKPVYIHLLLNITLDTVSLASERGDWCKNCKAVGESLCTLSDDTVGQEHVEHSRS